MVIEILVHLSAHKGFDCGQNERPHYISIYRRWLMTSNVHWWGGISRGNRRLGWFRCLEGICRRHFQAYLCCRIDRLRTWLYSRTMMPWKPTQIWLKVWKCDVNACLFYLLHTKFRKICHISNSFSAKFQIPQQKEYRKGSAVQTIAS